MRERVVYRIEQTNGDGFWFSKHGEFTNTFGKKYKNVPMPEDKRDSRYIATCFSLKEVFEWIPIEALNALKDTMLVTKYKTKDYKVLDRGEVIINKNNYIYRKVLHNKRLGY